MAILSRRGGRLEIVTDEHETPHWVIAEEVPDIDGEWLHALPAAPLDALRDGTPWQRLRALVSIERRDLSIIVVYASVVGLLSLVIPIGVQTLVTTLAFGALMQPIVVMMVLLASVLAFVGILRTLQFQVVELLRQRAFARTAVDVAHRLPRADASRIGVAPPELVNRFLDVIVVQKSATGLLTDGLALVLQTTIGMLVLAFYHPFLLAFDATLVVCLAGIVLLGHGATRASVDMSKAKYEVVAWLEEIGRHTIAFKSPGGMAHATARTTDVLRSYLAKARKRFSIVFRQMLATHALQAVAFTALLGIGGWLVIRRQLTIGQLIAAEIIVAGIVDGFTKIGKHFESYYDLLAAMDKLGQLVDVPCERADGHVERVRGGLRGAATLALRDVSVEIGSRTLLANVSFDLEKGESMGIVGGEASGKTVLARVLWGLLAPDRGTIEIAGFDTRNVALDTVRRQVAVVGETPEIFSGSVAENASLSGASREEIQHVLAAVGLSDAVRALPMGVDTHLGSSPMLSASQLARLMIARAILGKPRVLVVDGILDDLDAADELLDVLANLDTTLVVLTKQERIARKLSKTCFLRDGRLESS